MQGIAIARLHDLREDVYEVRLKIDKRLRGAHAYQPVRIHQSRDQKRQCFCIVEVTYRDDGSEPHKPDGVTRQFGQDIQRKRRLHVR